MDERPFYNLRDDQSIGDIGLQPARGGETPKGDTLFFNQIFKSYENIQILTVMFGELVIVFLLEPLAALVVCNEKSGDDASPCASRALRDAQRWAIPWGR